MQATLIENNDNGRIAYDSLILSDPKALSVLNSKIAMRIVKLLSETPCCAIDVARKLKIHEQKIYYHLRNLEKAGIVYIISQERRHGMIAKIYSVVSPVVATKLFEKGVEIKETLDIKLPDDMIDFFSPFINSGKFESKIIIGDPLPHGQYSEGARDISFSTDFLLFFGTLINELKYPTFLLDVEVTETDLKDNLILIGNPKTNTVIEKFLDHMPIKLDLTKETIKSQITNNEFKGPFVGYIVKFINPLNKNKRILLIGGLRSRGTRSASVAITKHFQKTFLNLTNGDNVVRIVEGVDRDSDKMIDDIKILE